MMHYPHYQHDNSKLFIFPKDNKFWRYTPREWLTYGAYFFIAVFLLIVVFKKDC